MLAKLWVHFAAIDLLLIHSCRVAIDLLLLLQGIRMAADESSGHDYDGDDMLLCWDQRVVQHVQPMPALPTQAPVPDTRFVPSTNDAMQPQMLKYFSECIMGTTLGKIANALRVVADTEGSGSAAATELANLCMLQVHTTACMVPA